MIVGLGLGLEYDVSFSNATNLQVRPYFLSDDGALCFCSDIGEPFYQLTITSVFLNDSENQYFVSDTGEPFYQFS